MPNGRLGRLISSYCLLFTNDFPILSKGVEINGSSYSSFYEPSATPVCQLATFSVQLSQEITFNLTRYHFDKVLIAIHKIICKLK